MILKAITLLFCGSALALHAESRPWKSADGERSIQGEFLKRDDKSITVRRSDGKSIDIPLDLLHPDDRTWLNLNHPLPGTELPPKAAVFDQLAFGDTRQDVLAKLHASKFVELTVDDIFLARAGLNGVFRTRHRIGGLDTLLYFDWTDDNGLKEILLQTDALPSATKEAQLVPCWKEFIDLLTTLHGKPIHENNDLNLTAITDGQMSGTHLWKLDGTGSAVLGAAREGDKFQVVVRFTQENVEPVLIPAPAQATTQNP